MRNKVLIFGGAGFIGLGIARFLDETRDCEITIAWYTDFYESGGQIHSGGFKKPDDLKF